jgi:hypothetical protein
MRFACGMSCTNIAEMEAKPMRWTGTICILLVLAGCANPRARCERDLTAELATLDRQIALSQQALAQGFREELVRPRVTVGMRVCSRPSRNVGVCADTRSPPQRARIAIDPDAERRTLSGLQARRSEVLTSADRDIAQCVANAGR